MTLTIEQRACAKCENDYPITLFHAEGDVCPYCIADVAEKRLEAIERRKKVKPPPPPPADENAAKAQELLAMRVLQRRGHAPETFSTFPPSRVPARAAARKRAWG